MLPELSISRVTTVSRNSVSRSVLVGERLHVRVDDDAGQAAGIEHAFLEVELPGTGLLGHQAALQAVGEAGDDALQVLQLLVELLAEAGEFVGVAEVFGGDLLVESAGVGAVVAFGVVIGAVAARLRAGGLSSPSAPLALVVGGFAGLVLGVFAFHFLGRRREHAVLLGLLLAFVFGGIVLGTGLF